MRNILSNVPTGSRRKESKKVHILHENARNVPNNLSTGSRRKENNKVKILL